jgi:hypothetical protein
MENIVHISLGFGITLGRIYYYYEKEWHCMLMDNIGIVPFSSTKVCSMADYLLGVLTTTPIDWKFNYPTTTPRKKRKITDLLKANTDITKPYLIKWLVLLM